jgi:hypothetical protein
MAAETSGGRIGRTVYLEAKTWSYLESLAAGHKHPAVKSHQTRRGSVSAVIEALVTWDAAARIQEMEKKQAEQERRLDTAKTLKRRAHDTRYRVEGVEREVTRLLTDLKAALADIEKAEV